MECPVRSLAQSRGSATWHPYSQGQAPSCSRTCPPSPGGDPHCPPRAPAWNLVKIPNRVTAAGFV